LRGKKQKSDNALPWSAFAIRADIAALAADIAALASDGREVPKSEVVKLIPSALRDFDRYIGLETIWRELHLDLRAQFMR
jgi:hypothetical protein